MKSIRTLMTLCLFLAATHVFAQSEKGPMLRVKVPFAFTVGDETFPAGNYLISTVQPERTLRIAGEGGNRPSSIQTVSQRIAIRPSPDTRVVFVRYGNSYFLKEVWNAGSDSARVFPQSKHETEMAKSGVFSQFAEVIQASPGR